MRYADRAQGTVPRHPMAVVVDRTGLTPDLLRAWERRYGAVAPSRGPGGQRLYSDDDIERLRLLHVASRAGRSIGQIATLSNEALAELSRDDSIERLKATPSPSPVDARIQS